MTAAKDKTVLMKRKIVRIDEELCDGCGICVDACHESALEIVDGKAKLVSDIYCDGLGDCLSCPQDAITIVEREAAPYDDDAVKERVKALATAETPAPPRPAFGGCPGAAVRSLQPRPAAAPTPAAQPRPSQLRNWPVQLHLVPVQAPFYDRAKLLIAADCTAFAHPDFHGGPLEDRTLIIGCPKLDDTSAYLEKLSGIFRFNDVASVDVLFMEVPCCFGLVRLVKEALEQSGKDIPVSLTRVGVRGEEDQLR